MDEMDLGVGRGAKKFHADLQLGHNNHSSCYLTRTHTQCFVALVMFCSGNFTTLKELISFAPEGRGKTWLQMALDQLQAHNIALF